MTDSSVRRSEVIRLRARVQDLERRLNALEAKLEAEKQPTACARGHSTEKYRTEDGGCRACRVLKYVASLDTISDYHIRELERMGLNINYIDLEDYRWDEHYEN